MQKYREKGNQIIKRLKASGYQAYFVGGFVRDYLLGLDANDIDITTDALPKDVMRIFPKTRATGIRFGTISVWIDDYVFEVTTFREDNTYLNHRKPVSVTFSKTLEEDLKRRDFTINAFAMTEDDEIIDLYHGKEDLNNQIIKAIGNPSERFNEDALRILRAFRFVAKLDFNIECATFKSIQEKMHLLKEISNERILMEIKKIFSYPHVEHALKLLNEAAIEKAFPELKNGLEKLSKQKHYTLNYLEFLALCFYTTDQEIPSYWRLSNKEKAYIYKIMELVAVTEHDEYNEMIIYRLGKEVPLMANRVSVILNPENDQANRIKNIYQDLPIHKTCDLAFKGQDILALTSIKNAQVIGDIIDDITYEVIMKNLENDYEAIKAFTLNLLESKYGKR